MTQTIRASVGGTATVHCVHDRQKRQVVTEAQVFEIGFDAGVIYDPKQHKIWRCTCCDNLFADVSDEPRHCHACRRPPVHALAAPLHAPSPEPI